MAGRPFVPCRNFQPPGWGAEAVEPVNRVRLRVLMVADVSPLQRTGGSARVLKEQARRLAERGHTVQLLCRQPRGDLLPDDTLDGVSLRHYPVNRDHSLSYATTSIFGARTSFRDYFQDQSWDVALFHQPLSALGVQPELPSSLPRLYCFHSPAGTEYRLRAVDPKKRRAPLGTRLVSAMLQRAERRALANSDGILVLSDFSRRLLAETHHGLAAPVVTIPGGVDLDHFRPAPDRLALRDRLNLPKDALLLLTVRDLEQRMGIDTLLKALRRLPEGRPVHCLIGGTGPLRRFLEELATHLGLADRVQFLGYIPEDQLPLYYQVADLFVLPTRSHEGFGLVTVEALACGTPVVATPAGATPEILFPLEARLLASDTGESSLASSLQEALPLARDEAFRRRCRTYAETSYSWDRHAERLEGELLACTARTPSRHFDPLAG